MTITGFGDLAPKPIKPVCKTWLEQRLYLDGAMFQSRSDLDGPGID